MRYISRGYHNGDLSDEECAKVEQAYRRRLIEVKPQLPPALLLFSTELSLHDAIIERVRYDPHRKQLRLSLVALSKVAYELVEIDYEGVLLGERRVETLRRAALSRETEILYNEVDVDPDGLFVHRFLFWPCEEVTLEFTNCKVQRRPRLDQRVNLTHSFIEDGLDEEIDDD